LFYITGMLRDTNRNLSPESLRPIWRRRWITVFFVAWPLFVIAAGTWLLFYGDFNGGVWVLKEDTGEKPLSQWIGAWLNVVDLNFRGTYPWILLAPYVAWLGLRFTLERDRWRASLAAHLAGCALFVIGSHTFTNYGASNRRIVFTYTTDENGPVSGNITRTNSYGFASNSRAGPFSNLPPRIGAPMQGITPFAQGGAFSAGAGNWMGPDSTGKRHSFFWMRNGPRGWSDLFSVLAYCSLVGFAQAFHFHRRSREREHRAAVLEAQLAEARLSALQAQLHPHFLFNALNAISTLLRRDAHAAQNALAAFSDLLRMALNQSNQPEVPLCEDLRFLRQYVEIQTMRLGDRLRFEEFIPNDVLDCLVPTLLFQPLVENAIRHGVEPSSNPGLVRITAEANGRRLCLTVEDTGVGISSATNEQCNAGPGIGLENLRARLKSLHGTEQSVEFGPRAGGGFKVRVEIPLRHAAVAGSVANACATV
jgi:hypothetical protein